MNSFTYVTPKDLSGASASLDANSKILAGGIDLLSEMKEGILSPAKVVNLKGVAGLRDLNTGGDLKIGALVTLTEVAENKEVRARFRAVGEAAESVASPQIRNVGTVGGNLCQRPRCWYYRDPEIHCLKKGGTKCYAAAGENEYHAILGGGPCHIVHPSDMAPALIALDAKVDIFSAGKVKTLPLREFFVLPIHDVHHENVLRESEIVTGVSIPKAMAGWHSSYYKGKERQSFDWSLSSAAVALKLNGHMIADARVVLGGVAPIPWRSREAEDALKGKTVSDAVALTAGNAAVAKATPLEHNAYKVKLAANVVRIAVLQAAGIPAV